MRLATYETRFLAHALWLEGQWVVYWSDWGARSSHRTWYVPGTDAEDPFFRA